MFFERCQSSLYLCSIGWLKHLILPETATVTKINFFNAQFFMNTKTKILITGATGNVGIEVLKSLAKLVHNFDVYAGVREIEKDGQKLQGLTAKAILFDFTIAESYDAALTDCAVLFLLRPPQLSAVKKHFKPLIEAAVQCGVKHIVFLSVQGVEKNRFIPHHKIEELIVESKIPYTFLRPAYFMQNFTTTLRHDLVENKKIFLPAGNAIFTLIDVADIGEAAAKILTETCGHINQCFELTCEEKLTFAEMAVKLSEGLHTKIVYESPSLLQFYRRKRKEKLSTTLIFVMILLHYLPRFQKPPHTTGCVERILHKLPKSFEQFIAENKGLLS